MKIAVALLTCDRYDYTVKTVESLLEHHPPGTLDLYHGDDASTDTRGIEYVQSKGFQTVMRNETRMGCAPSTDQLIHAVAEHVEPGTHVLYLQNDWETLRRLPTELVRSLLDDPTISFVQLSHQRPRSRYATRMGWAFADGTPWEYGDTSQEVVYSALMRGMGYPPSIATIETWLPAVEGCQNERNFRYRTQYRERRTCRLTDMVFSHIGAIKTPNGTFGRGWKDRRAAVVATIGVASPAYGVPQEIVDRFASHIPECVQTAIDVKPLVGMFNLARAKNKGVRELLGKCDIIVSADIDCLIPPGLLEVLPSRVKNGVCIWNPARNVHELNGESWEEWNQLPLRTTGKGSFIAMTSSDWKRTGGFDERYCYGWGKEDYAFLERRRAVGIRTERLEYPVVHIMHPKRQWKGPRQARRQRPEVPKRYTVNYLTGRRPRTRGIVMWVTSACPLSCEDCNQQSIMKADPDYHMTPEEVNLLCQCADISDDRFGRLDITGGEPLSWKYLREGVTRLNECSAFDSLWVFTSGIGKTEDLEWLASNVDRIRLSRHQNNYARIKTLQQQLAGKRAKVKVVDKRHHTPIPTEPVPGSTPGRCVCPSVCYTRGQAYICPNVATLLAQHGENWKVNPGLMEKLGPNFVDIRRNLGRTGGNIPWCALCAGNRRVAAAMMQEA